MRIVVVWNVRARELLEALRAIGFQTSIVAHPEGRRGRQREHVRQEIARGVHDMNLPVFVCDADVYVQAEDEQRARDRLQLFDEQLVTLVIENLLILPARDRVRRGGDDHQSGLAREPGDDAAQARDVGPRFLYVATDSRPDLDPRLNHLGLDLLAENHLALFQKFGDV